MIGRMNSALPGNEVVGNPPFPVTLFARSNPTQPSPETGRECNVFIAGRCLGVESFLDGCSANHQLKLVSDGASAKADEAQEPRRAG